MLFFGDFLCANEFSIPCTPTSIDNITRVELSDGWYDDLRITKNIEEELSAVINQNWDWDTILHAKFNDSVGAGNVIWSLDTVSHLLIKRKKVGDFKWLTLEVRKVKNADDFNVRNIDKTAIPEFDYEYAAVPIMNGVEGFYSSCEVNVKSDYLIIIDRDEIWCTKITDNYLDNVSIVPVGKNEPMYERFPTIISNSATNYEEITVNAQFLPGENEDGSGCRIDISDDKKLFEYNKRAKMFLRNGNFKILKSPGQIWGVYVTTPPSDTAQDNYKNRKLSFTMTETFDVEDEESLWEYGFLDENATAEWWNK